MGLAVYGGKMRRKWQNSIATFGEADAHSPAPVAKLPPGPPFPNVSHRVSTVSKVYCKNCRHFRSAPYEAKVEGCYHPDLMQAKQKDAFLDEQQMPGNTWKLNHDHDCEKYEAREQTPSIWKRLFSA